MLFMLLKAPFTAPISGIGFVLKQLQGIAEREIFDPQKVREDLLLLQLRLEEGEITEAEHKVLEAEIMERLRAARAYQERAGR